MITAADPTVHPPLASHVNPSPSPPVKSLPLPTTPTFLTPFKTLLAHTWSHYLCKIGLMAATAIAVTGFLANLPIATICGVFFLIVLGAGYIYTHDAEGMRTLGQAAGDFNKGTINLGNIQKIETMNVAQLKEAIITLTNENSRYFKEQSEATNKVKDLTTKNGTLQTEFHEMVDSLKGQIDLSTKNFTEINQETRAAAQELLQHIQNYETAIKAEKIARQELADQLEPLRQENQKLADLNKEYENANDQLAKNIGRMENLKRGSSSEGRPVSSGSKSNSRLSKTFSAHFAADANMKAELKDARKKADDLLHSAQALLKVLPILPTH